MLSDGGKFAGQKIYVPMGLSAKFISLYPDLR